MKLLVDLRDLAARSRGLDFARLLEALRQAQSNRPSVLERLRKVGL